MSDDKHWAYGLPDLANGETPDLARETVAAHCKPDYWAMIWGWSHMEVTAAKAAVNSHTA